MIVKVFKEVIYVIRPERYESLGSGGGPEQGMKSSRRGLCL